MATTPVGFAAGLLATPAFSAQWMCRPILVDVTPASVAANTVAEQDFTVAGATIKDAVIVSPSGITAGVGLLSARVSAANTVTAAFVNATAGALVPPAGAYLFVFIKAIA